MIRFVYWNIKQKGRRLLPQIVGLATEVDVLILSEPVPKQRESIEFGKFIADVEQATGMNYIGQENEGVRFVYLFYKASEFLSIEHVLTYKLLENSEVRSQKDSVSPLPTFKFQYNNRIELFRVTCGATSFILSALHFFSKYGMSHREQIEYAGLFKTFIDEAEEKLELKSIVVGDFNMDPFEEGMLSHQGFHALPSQELSEKPKNRHGVRYTRFYNPTWSKLGDFGIIKGAMKRRPSGSYYTTQANQHNLSYWHAIDQVIIRSELIQYFLFEEFEYVTTIKTKKKTCSLLTKSLLLNKEEYSDHLPIKFALKFENYGEQK